MAQELIGVDQARVFGAREQVFFVEAAEGELGAAVANPVLARTVKTLQALDKKFDISNAAAGKFDIELVFAKAATSGFFVDALAGGGHGLDSGEIQARGVDGGLNEIEQSLADAFVAGGNARFDEHLQLPVAGTLGVIVPRSP